MVAFLSKKGGGLTSASATVTNNTKNPTAGTYTYLNYDITLYNPTKTRSNGVDATEKSASFAGWFLDSALTANDAITVNGTVSQTNVSVTSCTFNAVGAKEWPTSSTEDNTITLYPKWMWNIITAYNSYGYVTCNGAQVTSSTAYYYEEGSKPSLTFVPDDGYSVYTATIKGAIFWSVTALSSMLCAAWVIIRMNKKARL